MRRIIKTTLGVCVLTGAMLLAGYADTTAIAETRVESARYYTDNNGMIVTKDGNEWGYYAETLNDAFCDSTGKVWFNSIQHEAKNDVPVWVRISDNGTPDIISDDKIMTVGLDFSKYMDEVIEANNIEIRKNWEFIEKTDDFIKSHNYK